MTPTRSRVRQTGEHLRNMTDAESEQNARDGLDNASATPEELAQAKHIPPEQQQE